MTEAITLKKSPSPLEPSVSPKAPNSPDDAASHVSNGGQSSDSPLTKVQSAPSGSINFPSKSDKPRPHVCSTCSRSFARLEHLKRHERSHTKEKPFECPECTRCFARRDLLLRHQQKLHLTATPTSRAGKGRRESIAGAGVTTTAKVRKGSTANGSASMRPRANTISHVEAGTLGMLNAERQQDANGDYSINGTVNTDKPFGGSSTARSQGNTHALPRLATQGLDGHQDTVLHTAPPIPGMNPSFGFDQVGLNGSTINPAQLHLDDSMDSTASNFAHFGNGIIEEDDNFDWMRSFNTQMNFQASNEQAIGESSPSGMSHGSAGAMDISQDASGSMGPPNAMMWQSSMQRPGSGAGFYPMDNGASLSQDLGIHLGSTNSPNMQGSENYYPSPPYLSSGNPKSGMNGLPMQMQNPMTFSSDGNSISSSSMTGSARHSSVTSLSTDSITETTRQALISSLSQHSLFGRGNRKYSQPAVSSPLSPRDASKAATSVPALPSTADLQRYVNAYILYFHPHFPFLHIPTLSFDTPAYNNALRPASPSGSNFGQGGVIGGSGCLVLAMAAIGALYELERPASKDLFDSAKKMIQLYLEERRKADMSSSGSKSNPSEQTAPNTPLWLVQAMLLNVIYGHNCGDKISGEIASTHCSALVSLARAAGLHLPLSEENIDAQVAQNSHRPHSKEDTQMANDINFQDPWNSGPQMEAEESQWRRWIVVEEHKRTLFAIFHMSSLLVSAYNHAPALMNSEVHLDLPCEEELWCAESASDWVAKGGIQVAQQPSLPFATALTTLLTASRHHPEHQGLSHELPFGSGISLADLPASNLRPSTFGCLVLINALHNYIWETRQRHSGRQWTTQETESMHAHIEPALRAWQAAWASNPSHSLERPNPFGLGPLSADSIPLLDLAYVRLFVNLGMSKEAFWQRDFDAMSEELARGSEFVQHADNSDASTDYQGSAEGTKGSPALDSPLDAAVPKSEGQDELTVPPSQTLAIQSRSSKRERHLRKAAFYAADSLSMSDKLGVTFADFTSRELPVQSALCTFDCAQVLAEWVATVQERVGRFLGIFGRDQIDYTQVPAIMLLEDEDCKLLDKIQDILNKVETKMTFEINNLGGPVAMSALHRLPSVTQSGFGSKILLVTAYMLERAAVWPVTNTMAHGLEIQAQHMNNRAENSTNSPSSWESCKNT